MVEQKQRFEVHVLCPRCGYDLFGLLGEPVTCPECGSRHRTRELLAQRKKPDADLGYWAGAACFFLWCVALCAVRDFYYESLSVATVLPPILCGLLGYGFPKRWWRPVLVFLAWPAVTALLTIFMSFELDPLKRLQEGGAMTLSIALSILLARLGAHLRKLRQG